MDLTHNFLLLPSQKIDVAKLLYGAGKTKEEVEQTIDVTGITALSHSENTLFAEFVFNGLLNLAKRYDGIFHNIDAVIVVSQSYDQRIPSVSTRIQKLLNLSLETFCIDIMDGCCGYIKALSIASMLNKNDLNKVLIVAGDLNSIMTTNAEIGTKILFGDGVSVSILEAGENRLDTKIFNDGDISNTISCQMEENLMVMNGFEVFRFTRNFVPKLIKSYLKNSNVDIGSYDLVALHQASDLVVSTIFKMLNLDNRLHRNFACGEIGNLGAGSIGAWLSQGENLIGSGKLKMLAVGFGSGLSWGIASLTVRLKQNEVIHV